MDLRNVVHKGLRRLIEEEDGAAFQPAVEKRLRNMVSFLETMERSTDLGTVRSWRAHQLAGRRKGVWALTVTGNRRLTFEIDKEEKTISDLNYEDYH